MSVPTIELHIEEVRLEGLPLGDRRGFAEALERELGRLVAGEHAERWAVASGGERERVDGGTVAAAPQASAATLGTQVAGAVWRGLSR